MYEFRNHVIMQYACLKATITYIQYIIYSITYIQYITYSITYIQYLVPGIHYSEPASRAWSCYSGVWIRDRVEWLAQFAIFENLNIVVDIFLVVQFRKSATSAARAVW